MKPKIHWWLYKKTKLDWCFFLRWLVTTPDEPELACLPPLKALQSEMVTTGTHEEGLFTLEQELVVARLAWCCLAKKTICFRSSTGSLFGCPWQEVNHRLYNRLCRICWCAAGPGWRDVVHTSALSEEGSCDAADLFFLQRLFFCLLSPWAGKQWGWGCTCSEHTSASSASFQRKVDHKRNSCSHCCLPSPRTPTQTPNAGCF